MENQFYGRALMDHAYADLAGFMDSAQNDRSRRKDDAVVTHVWSDHHASKLGTVLRIVAGKRIQQTHLKRRLPDGISRSGTRADAQQRQNRPQFNHSDP